MENSYTSKLAGLAKYKLKAGSLQLSIYIAVIIALILIALILYAGTFLFFKEQSVAAIENIQTADYILQRTLKNESKIAEDTLDVISAENENYAFRTNVSQWGIFEKVYVNTSHRKKQFTKIAMVGSKMHPETSPTLYLQDSYSPLSVVGTTLISGNIYLPSAGIKPGYINGEGFYRQNLTEGTVRKSDVMLPALSPEIVSGITSYFSDSASGYLEFDQRQFNHNVSNSFYKPVQKYISKGVITFENISVTGNIIYKSDTLVRIKQTAILKDIIVIAPLIEIEDGVKGNFQALSSRGLSVGKRCKLNYPTALILKKNSKYTMGFETNPVCISIGEDSKIFGAICYLEDQPSQTDYASHITIGKNVIIKGQVYCQGNLEVSGAVSGSVYTRQFIVNRFGTKFINHIFDAVIENKNVSESYSGILFDKNKKTIMKWMY